MYSKLPCKCSIKHLTSHGLCLKGFLESSVTMLPQLFQEAAMEQDLLTVSLSKSLFIYLSISTNHGPAVFA